MAKYLVDECGADVHAKTNVRRIGFLKSFNFILFLIFDKEFCFPNFSVVDNQVRTHRTALGGIQWTPGYGQIFRRGMQSRCEC
jgi:hypothetical protein